MSEINESVDGVIGQRIHKPFDLNQQVQSEPEVNSSPSDDLLDLNQQVQSEPEVNSSPSDDLSELQSSMESMLTKELEGEEMENGVHQPMKNEDTVLQLETTVQNLESENPTYRAATPPAPPPPSPSSLVSTLSKDLGEVSSGEFVPNLVLMGCTRCYIYVMVSDGDPKCPKCGSYDLLDEFRGNFGLCKRRKN